MQQTQIYNRTEALKDSLNDFLSSITKNRNNYFSNLSNQELIRLKSVLSDVNNILTLKATIAFTEWMVEFFHLPSHVGEELIDRVNKIKPNSNGFDILLPNEKIIAEIKCTVPINGQSKYGAAQKRSILTDALKLKNGKKSLSDTSGYIKIIGLLDLGERTDKAINTLFKQVINPRTLNTDRLSRNNIISDLVLIDEALMDLNDLTSEKIYIKRIKLN